MDRVYTLREESCTDGVVKYFIIFKDSTGVFQNLNVSEELYSAFRQLEWKNRNLQQSDQRHKEFNEVYDETLNRRARYIPKSVEKIIIETECSELLHKAVDSLPEIQMRRFLLYYEYDYNYYEITAMVGRSEMVIQSTQSRNIGDVIGMVIEPDDIHIMKKEFTVNKYDGYITKKNTVVFGDGEFECDVTQLYPGSHLDEEGYLITADGERIDLTDIDVTVEVDLKNIEISDNADEGGACGHIVSLIYKGDHYQYIVRTEENEEDFVFDSEDLWNENDYVSVKIKPENIRLTLKQENK